MAESNATSNIIPYFRVPGGGMSGTDEFGLLRYRPDPFRYRNTRVYMNRKCGDESNIRSDLMECGRLTKTLIPLLYHTCPDHPTYATRRSPTMRMQDHYTIEL